ncbi:MAG TPA: signal peptidase I [Acidimicrobiia bacterium]|nr:signal peptidase I [Acidimicrobiia bacterium]
MPPTSAESPYTRLRDDTAEARDTAPGDGGAGDGSSDPPNAASPAESKSKPTWAVVVEWVILIASALAIALLIKAFLFQAFYIPSDSMVPTLKTHDRVIVNKLSYRLHPVRRGDIIVFKSPKGPDGQPIDPGVNDLVKRVIALPGETVEGRRDGHIYINGKVLNEPYLPKGQLPGPGFAPIKVPPNSYWVMGDNRNNSRDSRFFPDHFIRKKDIIGRVFIRIWPLDRLGIL